MFSRATIILILAICLSVGNQLLYGQQFCDGTLSLNALPWGDFGSGPPAILPDNPNIAPGYQYDPEGPPRDGFYTIASNTRFNDNVFPCWLDIKDDSDDPDGYMMIINATQDPGVFLETIVQVCPMTAYTFVVSVHNLNRATCTGTTLPEIDFLINGTVIYQTGPIERSERWERYSVSFVTQSGESELLLQLRNNSPGGAGSDFAIDNIGFYHCGPDLKISQLNIPCEGGKSVFEANIAMGVYNNPIFEWQVSTDNGDTWLSLEKSTNEQYTLSTARANQLLRVKAAATLDNLAQELCHVTSDPINIRTMPAETKEATFIVCEGDFVVYQDSILTEEGIYLFEETDDDECIIIVSVKLSIVFSTIDTIVLDRYCAGDSFLGVVLETDTTLQELSKNEFGCDSITVFQLIVRPTTEIELTFDEWICAGQSSDFSVNSPHLQVIWNDGVISSNRPIGPGTYLISILDNQRCLQDTLVQIFEHFEGLNWAVDSIGCEEGDAGSIRIDFNSIPKEGYRLSINGQPQIINDNFNLDNLQPGVYNLALEDLGGKCSRDTVVEFIRLTPSFPDWYFIFSEPFIATQPIEVGLVTPQNLSAINWSGDGTLSCNTCETISWVPAEPGRLTLNMIDANGCQFTRDTILNLSSTRTRVFIPNAFTPNGDNINDQFELLTNQALTVINSFEIFDRWGNLLYVANTQNGNSPKWDGTVNGRQADPGIYIYLIKITQVDGQERLYRGTTQLIR